MFASGLIQTLVASALSPAFASPVARVSETPRTDTFVDAWIDVDPAVGELVVTVQEPVPPAVVQLDDPTNVAEAPPEFVSEKLITVPSGAFAEPVPSFTFT